jgi:hypothetical protein
MPQSYYDALASAKKRKCAAAARSSLLIPLPERGEIYVEPGSTLSGGFYPSIQGADVDDHRLGTL